MRGKEDKWSNIEVSNMAWIQDRLDRLRQLVATCIKNGKFPDKVGFADHVIGYSASMFGLSPRTAKSYLKTLIQAWNYDHWIAYVKNNDYLNEKERQEWISRHFKK